MAERCAKSLVSAGSNLYPGRLGPDVARRNKAAERNLALERVEKLISLAHRRRTQSPELSDRYVRLARRIAMRYQVPIPSEIRRRVCRGCDTLLTPGLTARVRKTPGRMSVTCLRCGTIKRYPTTKPLKVSP